MTTNLKVEGIVHLPGTSIRAKTRCGVKYCNDEDCPCPHPFGDIVDRPPTCLTCVVLEADQ